MKIFKSIQEFNEARDGLGKLSFVPTMGNLHKGHTSLIDIAKQFENKIISSIYVNKLQFNDDNDYLCYPKTLDADIELLERHGCDYLLIPNKFFKIIDPNIVIFGKKDYQQFILVKDFIKNNNLNIQIIGGNTIREPSGLALSSRNNLLCDAEKSIASKLYEVLKDIESEKDKLNLDLINSKKDYLESFGINVDYLISCDPESFEASYEIHYKNLLIAVAAYVGKVRLIDNLKLTKL